MSEANSMDCRVVLRGRPANPVGLNYGDDVVRLKDCPDCGGRGYFLISPFATGGSNGAGGMRNMCQCQTCADSKAYYLTYGELPPSVVADMEQHNTTDDRPSVRSI
jgi:hypothetical protein